jgi:hypothetical protein
MLQPLGYIHRFPNSETKEEKEKEGSRSTRASERKRGPAGGSVKAM